MLLLLIFLEEQYAPYAPPQIPAPGSLRHDSARSRSNDVTDSAQAQMMMAADSTKKNSLVGGTLSQNGSAKETPKPKPKPEASIRLHNSAN